MATQAHRSLRSPSQGPPPGWEHYFPTKEFDPDDRRTLLINDLAALFTSRHARPLLARAHTRHGHIVLPLDWTAIRTNPATRDIPAALNGAPTEALGCLGVAAFIGLFCGDFPKPPAVEAPAKVLVRLTNYTDSFVKISDIRAEAIGRLVSVRGTVARATPVRPLVMSMEFICGKCSVTREVKFPDGRYAPPMSCGIDGCRSKTLMPVRCAATCIDWQRVQLQGLPRDERGGDGRVPRPMDVELLEDLVEAAAPGELVTVTGIVKVLQGEPASGKRFGGDAKRQCLFLPYIEAISVARGPGAGRPGAGTAPEQPIVAEPEGVSYLPPNMPGFTQLDLDFIKRFTAECEGDQLRQLVRSLAPGICGLEAEKAGLLLALFGGVRDKSAFGQSGTSPKPSKTSGNSSSGGSGGGGGVPVRGDIHVLLVGDPGLGKSQLLQAAAAAAPRGVYVCGSSTSSAGLTVSVVRDGGDFCFDAGALVLADRGVCCVDEFDKATGEHAAMLGAMEQQEVAIAKAGLVAALPARATVLAAANPVDGHYNRGKTVLQNLKMSPAMISRFDLVFLLLDRPDAERDQRLTAHVMAAHSGVAARATAARMGRLEGLAAPLMITGGGAGGSRRPSLRERLRVRKPDDEPLPPQLLRKYIAYARQYVHPKLTAEAAAVLKEFYIGMRRAAAADPSAPPVTHRQLESLVRLAEARARVDLRERVTAEDAEEAVEIMKESLAGALTDGPSMLDFGGGDGGKGAGSRGGRGFQAERRRFIDALQRHCEAKGDLEVDLAELYSITDRIELAAADTAGFFEQLNEAGDLMKRGGGRFAYNGGLRPARGQFGGGGGGGGSGPVSSHQPQMPPRPPQQALQHQEQQRGAVAGKRGAPDDGPGGDDMWDDGFDW